MKDHDFKIKQKQHQYDLLKPLHMSNLAPRQGFYLILYTSKQLIAGIKCSTAKALWKLYESEDFDPNFYVTIQLKSLETKHSKGPKQMLHSDLSKRVIQIVKAHVVTVDNEKVFAVEWELMNDTISDARSSFDGTKTDLDLTTAIAESNNEDIELINAINAQMGMNDEIIQAVLRMEDNAFDEYYLTNEWVFALQAQNLQDNK